MTRRGFLTTCAAVLAAPVQTHASTSRVTLHATLTATRDESDHGRFTLTAAQLDSPITLDVGADSYLAQYLDGCLNHELVVTLEPQ